MRLLLCIVVALSLACRRDAAPRALAIDAEITKSDASPPEVTSTLEGFVPGASFEHATAIAHVTMDDAGVKRLRSIAIYADSWPRCDEGWSWVEWDGAAELEPTDGKWITSLRMNVDARFHPRIEGELPCPGHPDYHFGLGSGTAWIEIDGFISLEPNAVIRGRLFAASSDGQAEVRGRFEAIVCVGYDG